MALPVESVGEPADNGDCLRVQRAGTECCQAEELSISLGVRGELTATSRVITWCCPAPFGSPTSAPAYLQAGMCLLDFCSFTGISFQILLMCPMPGKQLHCTKEFNSEVPGSASQHQHSPAKPNTVLAQGTTS